MNEPNQNAVPAANRGRHKAKNDILFIIALLLTVSLIGACVFLMRGEGDTVEVTVDGKLYGVYALSQDMREEIRTGDGGEDLNVLVIQDGKAYVERATCPDGICSDHRPISRVGESIACLPHRVVIVITSHSGAGEPDMVV